MIIMDGYDPLSRCAQLIIGAAWAYSAPAVGLPQTPVPLVPMKSFEKRGKTKTAHEMIHETYETVIKKSYEQLWKLMKNVQTP
jgi:hypothetical protein